MTYLLVERRCGSGHLVRAVNRHRGRRLTRRAAMRLLRAEYRARTAELSHPAAWTYVAVERAGPAALCPTLCRTCDGRGLVPALRGLAACLDCTEFCSPCFRNDTAHCLAVAR